MISKLVVKILLQLPIGLNRHEQQLCQAFNGLDEIPLTGVETGGTDREPFHPPTLVPRGPLSSGDMFTAGNEHEGKDTLSL